MSQMQPHSQSMPLELSGNWWALALRGLAAALFSLLALIWPGVSLAVLILLFGAYALVDGVFGIAAAIRSSSGRRWLLLAEGVIGLLAGLVAFVWPDLTALALLYVIAFWAIFTGILKIATAISLRREIRNEWLLILSGVLSVLFGLLLAASPAAGLLALVWLIGVYALVIGGLLIALAFRVRGWRRSESRVA